MYDFRSTRETILTANPMKLNQYLRPKQPGGGGFGVEIITLEYLYKQYKSHNCIWTSTNAYKDLGRYTGGSITLFRHPEVDFVFNYSIMPPFQINQFTYPDCHPQNLLLRKHHRVILSKQTNPNGKPTVRIKFKPPKLMTNKWFFQKEIGRCTFSNVSSICLFILLSKNRSHSI